MMMIHIFVILKKGKKSIFIQANMILIPFDMTQICKEKAAIKKFSMFKNEKLIEIPS
jgi:hypothetical protein